MTVQFANGRNRLDLADFTIAVNTGGGSLSGGAYFFSLQGRNRIGKNLLAISECVGFGSSDAIEFTINPSANKSGEGWLYHIIGVSTTDDPTTFKQIARVGTKDPLTGIDTIYPITITFQYDFQLTGEYIVNTVADLPTETDGLLDGFLAGVSEKALIYEYRKNDLMVADGNLIIQNDTGNWVARSSFSTYVANTASDGGSRQDVNNLTDESDIITEPYDPNGSESPPVTFWLTNETGSDIAAGTRIDFQFFLGNLDKSKLFDSKAFITILGFTNLDTGILRTTQLDISGLEITDLNIDILYRFGEPSVRLGDRLQNNEAVVIQIKLVFISSGIGETGTVRILPSFAVAAGSFVAIGNFFQGGAIFNQGDFRRIVPNEGMGAIALSGSGIVGNFLFNSVPQTNIFGFQVNARTQRVLINGNGQVYLNYLATDPADSRLRALVSTESGVSQAAPFSSPVAVSAGEGIEVTIAHPIDDTTGNATIRSTYPDSSIAGNNKGKLSAPTVDIFIKNEDTGEIHLFNRPTIKTSASQTLSFTSPSSTIVTEDPDFTTQFSFYDPGVATLAGTPGGSWVAGNYSASYRYNYDGTSISDISHDPLSGCIVELIASFDEIAENSAYWVRARNKTQLRSLSSSSLRNGTEAKLIQDNLQPIGVVYNSTSLASDNDITVFKPDDLSDLQAGRWIVPGVDLDIEGLIQEQILIFGK